MKKSTRNLLSILILLLISGDPAVARPFFDFYGYSYLEGPANTVGTRVSVPMRFDSFQPDPVLPIDLEGNEVTIVLDDLEIAEVADYGGVLVLTYSGGRMRFYEDPARNSDWAPYPPNGSVPSTFEEGTLILEGSLAECIQLYDSVTGVGTLQGQFDFDGGTRLAELPTSEGWLFFGGTTVDPRIGIPDGYEMAWDPQLIQPDPIAARPATWGEIKARYRE